MLHRLTLFLLAFPCAALAQTQPSFPPTPAGKVLAAWINAFNSGDRVRMDAFLKKYAARVPRAELNSPQFRGQSGGLNLLAVTHSDKYSLAFRLKEKSKPTILFGKLDLTSSREPEIENFSLHPVPNGAVLDDLRLDSDKRKQTIEQIVVQLNQLYVYPTVADKMVASLRAHQNKGDYDTVTDGDAFASLLTRHLLEISRDKHLAVFYQPYKFETPAPPATLDEITENRKAMARDCGIHRIEVLANNVGYIKVDFFADPMACGRTAAAALSFLANTDAVIFDMRENIGGDPRMVALMCSYLFERPVHLNDFYDRVDNSTTPYWTPRFVPGIRLGQKPAYVLTSGHTFSGAEEFAYDLKNLRRVVVVGERSGGGAHVVSPHQLGDHFIMYVPHARSISPITGTDWEGSGVIPDVPVSAEDALPTAERLAAERIQRTTAPFAANAAAN